METPAISFPFLPSFLFFFFFPFLAKKINKSRYGAAAASPLTPALHPQFPWQPCFQALAVSGHTGSQRKGIFFSKKARQKKALKKEIFVIYHHDNTLKKYFLF